MIVVVVVCVVVIVGLVVAVLRLRGRIEELTDLAVQSRGERDRAQAEADESSAAADTAVLERDDALERVRRARRDAADVANRLRDETASRESVAEELQRVERSLEEAQATGPRALADVLWPLSVRQSARAWRVSVAVDPEERSPIDDADDVFRTVVEIEVDAAREESGAVIELVWSGDADVPTERGVVALALARDAIGALGTTAASTTLTIVCLDDAVEVTIEAVDAAGERLAFAIPASLEVEPGRARIS